MKMFESRLKRCPLCGSNDIYLERSRDEIIFTVYVGCAKCGLRGYKNFLHDCVDPYEIVIGYWNKREQEDD